MSSSKSSAAHPALDLLLPPSISSSHHPLRVTSQAKLENLVSFALGHLAVSSRDPLHPSGRTHFLSFAHRLPPQLRWSSIPSLRRRLPLPPCRKAPSPVPLSSTLFLPPLNQLRTLQNRSKPRSRRFPNLFRSSRSSRGSGSRSLCLPRRRKMPLVRLRLPFATRSRRRRRRKKRRGRRDCISTPSSPLLRRSRSPIRIERASGTRMMTSLSWKKLSWSRWSG
jgi:hypothetical protein